MTTRKTRLGTMPYKVDSNFYKETNFTICRHLFSGLFSKFES